MLFPLIWPADFGDLRVYNRFLLKFLVQSALIVRGLKSLLTGFVKFVAHNGYRINYPDNDAVNRRVRSS